MIEATFWKANNKLERLVTFEENDVSKAEVSVFRYLSEIAIPNEEFIKLSLKAPLCRLVIWTKQKRINIAVGKMKYSGKGDPLGYKWE